MKFSAIHDLQEQPGVFKLFIQDSNTLVSDKNFIIPFHPHSFIVF